MYIKLIYRTSLHEFVQNYNESLWEKSEGHQRARGPSKSKDDALPERGFSLQKK